MPSTLALGDKIKVRAWVKDVDQAAVNTITYLCTGGNTGGVTDQDVASSLQVNWNPFYVGLINNNAEWRGVQCYLEPATPGPTRAPVFDNSNPLVGTAGAVAAPRQTCGLIQFGTTNAGRQYRGRIYLPFPATADVALNGAPSASYGTRLNAFATFLQNTFFLTDVSGTKFIPCIQVLVHGPFGKPPQPGPLPSPIIQWSSSNRWATQRRRGAFGRLNASPI